MPLTLVGSFGTKGGGRNQLKDIRDIVVLPGGAGFIACDAGSNKLIKFDAAGEVVDAFFGPLKHGSGPSDCPQPSSLAMHGNELIVADRLNKRLQVYSVSSGAFVRTIPLPMLPDAEQRTAYWPRAICVFTEDDGTTGLYVLEYCKNGNENINRVRVVELKTGFNLRTFEIPQAAFAPSRSSMGLSGRACSIAIAGHPVQAAFVSDSIGSAVAFSPLRHRPGPISGMDAPYGIVCNNIRGGDRHVYVGEYGMESASTKSIHVFVTEGKGGEVTPVETFKIEGSRRLTGLRLSEDSSTLYACDSGAGCVWILSTGGQASSPPPAA
mmetsp:Transcript_55222/g.109674  ORF Transcript_55222/g.109674 Transcript_55222/m.109674 type:complete len:324 (-) Transcript_55222:300-1271(-)